MNATCLMNDLDLRVFDQSSTEHFPWKLNPANHTGAATRSGDNDRDNVEVIQIDNPTPGETYLIRASIRAS